MSNGSRQRRSSGVQVDGDRERAPPPVGEVARVARRILLEEELASAGALVRVTHGPCFAGEGPIADANGDGGLADQVLHPVGAIATAREHVEGRALEPEPDLDLARLSAHPTGRRQVAVALVSERCEVVTHASMMLKRAAIGGLNPAIARLSPPMLRAAQPGWPTIRYRFPSGSRKKNIGGTGSPMRMTSSSTSTPRSRRAAWSASTSSVANATPVSPPGWFSP